METPRTVFVDLDGTLIRGDLLWEGIRLMLRDCPLDLALRAPLWLLAGKAHFKAAVAARVQPDPRTLPYREPVLAYLAAARRNGAKIVLASASPAPWVRAIAAHLSLFDDVMASSETENLSGTRKRDAIRELVGNEPFEYIGDSAADLPIWRVAARATSVAPTTRARRGLAGLPRHAEIPLEKESVWRAAIHEMRPHQWTKNALIFVPLLLAHELADPSRLVSVLVAFLTFCAVASAGYVLNDLIDADADRAHPTKSRRPIARGALPVSTAFGLLGGLLLAAALSSALWLSWPTAGMVATYFGLTLSYSFYFKRQLLLDVLLLAGLYTHRVLTGGIAAEVAVSPWLLAFSAFFFLSLALVKRYVELSGMIARDDDEPLMRRAYQAGDLALVESMGLACAYISVLVLCLFVSSSDVSHLYRTPELLWLMSPIMFYWISRIWLLAHRGELNDDPVLFATTDRNSHIAGILLVAIVVAAAW